jgi:Putative transmembrane protein (Alph_Pro_TM)
MKIKLTILSLALTTLFIAAFSTGASAFLTAKTSQDHISIGFFYGGSEVSVSGLSDPGDDYIIAVTSPECNQALKRKGKVAGALWMNVGELKCEKVPNLYFVQCSKKLDDLLPVCEQDRCVLGYPALERHMNMEPAKDQTEKNKWFGEFIKYKESKKLFANSCANFQISSEGGKQKYSMKFAWPYQAPPGDYLVTVYAVQDKKVVGQAVSKVTVEQVGAVKKLAAMAKNQGALYGILAIVTAITAGFGVGIIFGKGGGAH